MIKGLHHIGIASKNIAKDILFFKTFGYAPDGNVHEDTAAKICVQFLKAIDQPLLELVTDTTENGPVSPHLKARRKIFHFAYETDNIEMDAKKIIEDRGSWFLVPITYVENDKNPIKAWCYLGFRNGMITELLELRKLQNDLKP